MEEQSTTPTPVSDGGSQTIQGVSVDSEGRAVESQPEQAEQVEAVAPSSDVPSQDAETQSEPQSSDNSATEWLKKKGVDPTSPEALEKVAEMARNAEKAMHEKAQKASELEKSVQTTQDELPYGASQPEQDSVRVRNIELKQSLIDWRLNNPDKREEEAAMTRLLQEDPNLKAMVREGYLDFDKLHAMAKGLDSSRDDTLKSQGKKEALQTLAQNQQAAVPQGNAVNPAASGTESITPQNVDSLVGSHSLEWFQQNRDAINKAMAG